MADVNKLAPLIFKWEGGWANNKADRGGKTNMGITLNTWKSCGYDKDKDKDIDADDLRLVTKQDVINLLKEHYWDRWQADNIRNQSVANILVDWVWGSGKWGIIIPQRILNVKDDGIVGMKTIEAVNNYDAKILHSLIKEARIKFIEDLCFNDPTQHVFKKGWLNRLNDYKYEQKR